MTQPAAAPFIDGRIAANALELMDVSGSGMRLRPLENAVGRRHRREDVDGENQRCDHRRPALGDIIARSETDAGSNEAYLLAQLRAAVAAFETPAHRLLAKYRGRPTCPAQFLCAHRGWDDPCDRTIGISGPALGKRPCGKDAIGSAATESVGQ